MPQPRGPCDASSCQLQLWGPPRTGGLQAPEPAALAKVRGIGTSWGLSGRASPVPRWQRLGAVCRCDATGLLTATSLRCSSDQPWTRSRQVCMGEQDRSHFAAMETDARKSQDHLSPELLPTPPHTHIPVYGIKTALHPHLSLPVTNQSTLLPTPTLQQSPHPVKSIKTRSHTHFCLLPVSHVSTCIMGGEGLGLPATPPSRRRPWFRACPAGHLLST